ncbi:MAG: HAMP domain-containing sensor histidine kinase [Pseudomonadota bacterium]
MNPIGKIFRSAAFRLSLAYLAVIALFAGALIGYVAYSAEAIFEARTRAIIAAEVRGLAEQYAEGGIQRLASTVNARSRRQTPDQSLYLLTAFSGARIAGNIEAIAPSVMRTEGPQRVVYVPDDGGSALSGEATVHVFPLEGGFALLVGRDISDQKAFETVLRQSGIVAGVLMLVLGVGGGFYVSQRVLSRIDVMSDASGTIMAGNLAERIPVTGRGDEFDRLAERLNIMLARIEKLVLGMREVTDNVAHDLRTPLTRLKARAEDALRALDRETSVADTEPDQHRNIEGIIDDADSLIRMFNALLAIARTQAGEGAAFTQIDLGELIGEATELYQPLAEDAGAELSFELPQNLPTIMGSRPLLAQAMANLLDNAIKYGIDEGETGSITVSATISDMDVDITIADHGPGIPETEYGHVLDRFVRLDRSRNLPGSGLGLSLVSAVAERHNGSLSFADNEPGLAVTLRLPKASENPGDHAPVASSRDKTPSDPSQSAQ